jgi:hypothetical protein
MYESAFAPLCTQLTRVARLTHACVQDLVGLRVFLQATGEELGHVSDVFDGTGTHDVLRIQLAPAQLQSLADAGSGGEEQQDGGEAGTEAAPMDPSEPHHVLLPFAKALVPEVDLAAGLMSVAPPEGLLQLATPSNQRRARRENRGQRERRRTRPRGQAALDAGAASSDSGNEDQ